MFFLPGDMSTLKFLKFKSAHIPREKKIVFQNFLPGDMSILGIRDKALFVYKESKLYVVLKNAIQIALRRLVYEIIFFYK